MKLQDLSIEQLKEIVKGAPRQAVVWNDHKKRYQFFSGTDCYAFLSGSRWEKVGFAGEPLDSLIPLSDIRTAIAELEPVFKVGDLVVAIGGDCTEIFEIDRKGRDGSFWDTRWRMLNIEIFRHATPEEIAAGYRIDEPSSSCGMTAVEIDQFGEDLRNKPYVDFPEFEQPDTITTQLDPAKCRVVDPALAYDSPSDCPKDDFDAMSEKHRSPSCKCHELPIDAELKPDPVNHPCKAAKKIKKLKKRIAQLERDCQFSELKAKDWAHKYWDSVRDNAGLYSALEEVFAARAAEYEAEIERLKGEQGE